MTDMTLRANDDPLIANATFTLYTDRAAFEAALRLITIETFDSFTLDKPLLRVPLRLGDLVLRENGDDFDTTKIDVAPFTNVFGGMGVNGTPYLLTSVLFDQHSIDILFDNPVAAFGGDFLELNDSLPITRILLDGVATIIPPATDEAGGRAPRFFGFISDTPFTQLGFKPSGGEDDSFALDNLTYSLAPVPSDHDFNRDGQSDILWRKTDGSLTYWAADGNGFDSQTGVNYRPDASWKIAGTGDFNGDNFSDILWRNDDGRITDWVSQGTSASGQVVTTGFALSPYGFPVDNSWKIQGTGDFNGDGRDDILWRNDNGAMTVWLSPDRDSFDPDSNYGAAIVGADWRIAGVGDFNREGRDDILWRNIDAGTGDFNGDDRDAILWRREDGLTTDWLSDGTGFTPNDTAAYPVGNEWAIFI